MSAANGRASQKQSPLDAADALLMAGKTANFTIPSVYAAGRDIQERIIRAVQHCGFSCDATFAIRLALEEAMINAIKHGNRLDPAKNVHVQATVTPKKVRISIEDEGAGFRRHHVPDPTCPENLCKQHGRGILLMESYMDRIRYTNRGRRVTMEKANK